MHLPDPVISPVGELGPEGEALLVDSVGLALQVVLDAPAPAERLAFVPNDMFEMPFDEIALMVGQSPTAARQLPSRARLRVKAPTARRAVVTSTPWSPYSTPTSCCEPTSARAAYCIHDVR